MFSTWELGRLLAVTGLGDRRTLKLPGCVSGLPASPAPLRALVLLVCGHSQCAPAEVGGCGLAPAQECISVKLRACTLTSTSCSWLTPSFIAPLILQLCVLGKEPAISQVLLVQPKFPGCVSQPDGKGSTPARGHRSWYSHCALLLCLPQSCLTWSIKDPPVCEDVY